MRSINLLKLAAEAEKIRLEAMMARHGRRAAFGVIALVFVLGMVTLLEIAGWQALCLYVAPIYATLILLGINLVFAGIFGLLAARSSPGPAELDALRVRQDALTAARSALAITALIPTVTTLLRLRHSNRPLTRRSHRSWLRPFR